MRSLLRLLPYMRRYRREYAGGLGLVLCGSLLAVASPLIIKTAIDRLSGGAAASGIGLLLAALLCVGAARALVLFRGRFALIATSRRVEYDMRQELFERLVRLPASFFDRHSSGDVSSRVINDVEGVRMVAGIAVMMIASSGVLFLLSITAMFALDARLAAIAIIPLILVSLLTSLLTERIYRQSEKVQDKLSAISAVAVENFSGARVVRAFCQEDNENAKFSAASSDYKVANLELALTRGVTWGLMTFLIEATVALTLLVGGAEIIAGTLTPGEFVAITAYEFALAWPVIAMGWIITVFQRGAACMDRLGLILDATPAETPRAAPAAKTPSAGCAIEVRGLTFRYSEERTAALEDVSLKIAPGERVAIVGRTGAGKSTLIQILLGLYRVPDGTVLIDGVDINAYPRGALRSAVGGVPQDAFLFSDTLAANIAFGAMDGASAEGIALAAEDARLSEDLGHFPAGIEQVIGERGITLSGGQKQRTAIARALIRRPGVLLLDDALSSVDVHTERDLLARLDAFLKGKTCLIVAHRFSAVAHVDRILVFDAGKLVDQGTHRELIARKGLYAELAARQRLEEVLEKS